MSNCSPVIFSFWCKLSKVKFQEVLGQKPSITQWHFHRYTTENSNRIWEKWRKWSQGANIFWDKWVNQKYTLLAWPITLHLSKLNKKETHTFPWQNFKWILEDLCTWQLFAELGAPGAYCSILNELIKVVCCYFLQKHFHSLRKHKSPKTLTVFKGMTLSYSCSHYILYTPLPSDKDLCTQFHVHALYAFVPGVGPVRNVHTLKIHPLTSPAFWLVLLKYFLLHKTFSASTIQNKFSFLFTLSEHSWNLYLAFRKMILSHWWHANHG